jgi:hypothetical protein
MLISAHSASIELSCMGSVSRHLEKGLASWAPPTAAAAGTDAKEPKNTMAKRITRIIILGTP